METSFEKRVGAVICFEVIKRAQREAFDDFCKLYNLDIIDKEILRIKCFKEPKLTIPISKKEEIAARKWMFTIKLRNKRKI